MFLICYKVNIRNVWFLLTNVQIKIFINTANFSQEPRTKIFSQFYYPKSRNGWEALNYLDSVKINCGAPCAAGPNVAIHLALQISFSTFQFVVHHYSIVFMLNKFSLKIRRGDIDLEKFPIQIYVHNKWYSSKTNSVPIGK